MRLPYKHDFANPTRRRDHVRRGPVRLGVWFGNESFGGSRRDHHRWWQRDRRSLDIVGE